jgi:glycosyltransferase involved in cell wall biosynthesis
MLPKRKVDITLPNYNYARFLDVCIEKILNQRFADFNLLIIDNGSTDGSHDLIREWQKRDDRITFIVNEENLGVTGSIMKGTELGCSDYMMYLPADDRIEPDYLSLTVAALDEFPQAAMAYTTSKMCPINANLQIIGESIRYVPHYESGLHREIPFLFIHGVPDYNLVRRACHDEFGGFQLPVGESIDRFKVAENGSLFYKMAAKYPFYYVKTEEALIWSLKHPQQVSKQLTKDHTYFALFVNSLDYIFRDDLFPLPIKLAAKAVQYSRFTGVSLAKIAELMLNSGDAYFKNAVHSVALDFLYHIAELILSQFHLRGNPVDINKPALYGSVNDAAQILGFLTKNNYPNVHNLLNYHQISLSVN